MKHKTIILVADKFINFTTDKKVVTVSQLHAMLSLPEHIVPGPVKVVLGQGVSDTDIECLHKCVNELDISQRRWDITELSKLPERAKPHLSHKRTPCNTLIGTPWQLGDGRYRMELCIDENSELMADHQTGQHVQGMILIEASRQAFLAVTESFYLKEKKENVYFVINSINTDFIGFVFPIRSHIDYRVVSKDINDRRQKFMVEAEVVQGSEVRVRTEFSFIVYPNRVISEREAALARDAVDVFFQSISQPDVHLET